MYDLGLPDFTASQTTAPIKTPDNNSETNLYTMAGSLLYGTENGPILNTADMNLQQFIDASTSVNLNYDYSNMGKTIVFDSGDSDYLQMFVNTGTTLANTARDAVASVYNTIDAAAKQAGSNLLGFTDTVFDSIFYKLVMVLGIALVAIWIIAKSGILPQASAFI